MTAVAVFLPTAALAAYITGEIAVLSASSRRWSPALLWPLGELLISYGLVRATWLAKRNGGVRWREAFLLVRKAGRGPYGIPALTV